MPIYLPLSTVLLLFLAFIWSKDRWSDAILKFILYGVALCGLAVTLQYFGIFFKR